MSKYTTQVRYICENAAGYTESKGYNDVQNILETAAPLVFNFDFPIFDENYRLALEIKILRHYYTREICEETVGLWKLRLQDRLNVIMPYYNQLYRSELLEFNPFYDVDIVREHEGEHEGGENSQNNSTATNTGNTTRNRTEINESENYNINQNTGESNSQTESIESNENNENETKWDLYSDTPSGGIEGIEGIGNNVNNNYYLTNARKNTGERTSENDAIGSATNQQNTSVTDENTGHANNDVVENEEIGNTNTNSVNGVGVKNVYDLNEYVEKVHGKQGTTSYSKMLTEFRETFLNIDARIIDELSDLFIWLW